MDQCLSLPFDQFQRYKLVSDIINKFRTGAGKFKILDVGAGFEENLKKFLPLDDIYYLDKEFPPEYFQKEHFIPGDIFKTEFHEKYDFIVAIDVYEHIPQINRKKFIDILIRLSDIATIIAAPFDQDEVRKCEFFANEIYKTNHGSDYIWLKEHIENGLPSLPDTQALIKNNHLNFVILPNGYLPRWFEMISTFLLTEGKPEFQPMMTTLYELYNQNYYEYDNRNPAYRQVIVIPKGDQIIDFSDLAAKKDDPVELTNKNLLLGSFIEKIKNTTYQTSDNQFTELTQHIHNLEAIVADRETQIADFRLHARNLETMVTEQNCQIAELKIPVRDLEATVTDRDNQIAGLRQRTHNLEATVTDRDNKIAELKQHARNLEFTVTDRDHQITELRQHACNLEAIITDRDQQLREFIRFNQSLSNENLSMKQSITYNLTTKFHKKIVERLLPLNTKRRKYYNLGLSGSRLLVNEGWDRLWWCYRERKQPLPSGLDHSIPISLPKENRQKVDNLPVIQKKISVIIPTKNAGDDFSFTLEKIQNQKGMQNIEIIIVDSGSTDNTLSLAEKYGARIITILPEEFNHGKTRNLGASNADGDYILFMVQDAIPVGGYCIYNMIKFLESDRSITAASCRQIPRSDADFFTCYLLWNHNRVLGFNSDKITTIVDNFENLSPLEKRKIAGIDNVFCLFRADIFKKMMFNSREYAEDLDLGLRLIQKGYSLGFVYSTAIIHSHNRNPEYFFRRAFVDTLELSILLGKEKNFNHNDRVFETVFGNIITMSFIIQKSIDESLETGPVTLSENAMNFFKNRLQLNYNTFSEGSHVHSLKRTTCFNEIFQRCMTICYPKLIVPDEDIFNSYVQLLDSFYDYLKTFPSIESRDDEFYNSLLKLFAIYAGSNLANAYLKDRSVDSDKKMLIKKTIYEGI